MSESEQAVQEPLLPIVKAFEIATGHRPSQASAYRWRTKGVRGVRLNAILYAGQWRCTIPEARCFNDAVSLAAAGSQPTPQVRTNRSRDASIAAAERQLSELGA